MVKMHQHKNIIQSKSDDMNLALGKAKKNTLTIPQRDALRKMQMLGIGDKKGKEILQKYELNYILKRIDATQYRLDSGASSITQASGFLVRALKEEDWDLPTINAYELSSDQGNISFEEQDNPKNWDIFAHLNPNEQSYLLEKLHLLPPKDLKNIRKNGFVAPHLREQLDEYARSR